MWPCSSGTDGLDGPPTGRRAAAGELNYTLNWVGFDSFIRTHLDIPSARFSPPTQRESREGFHGERLDTRSSATGETGDQNNNAAPGWLSVSPRSTKCRAAGGRRFGRTRPRTFARLCVFAMFDRPMDRGRCVQHDRSAQFRA